MKKITILFLATFALVANEAFSQVDDSVKKSAIVFVENGEQQPFNGQVYRSSAQGGASRSGNGNSNGAFGNIADWAVDLTVSEQSPEQAANSFQAYTNQGHPVYTAHSGDENYGDGSLSMNHAGMGSTGWGSFSANAYNRSSGVGSVALGFHNMAGHPVIDQGLSYDNMGAFAAGFSNRAWGNRSFVSGMRNLALADDSHAMGHYNYATGSATFALVANEAISQVADQDKKPAVIFVEDGDQNPFNGKVYRSSVSGAARSGNGNSNDAFANQGDWSVDLVISERTPENAAQNFGGFTESGHPLYTGGDGNWSTISEGMGAAGWGSFAANAYNRAAGLGGVALGFNTLSGPQVGAAGGIDGGNVGQFSAGWGSRAIGNISTATGFRNTASGQASVALGNYNYATGDATIAVGKENWAEGASTVAIGYKNHAAGAGSVALGQENIAWGTTNFTSGYQNVAGDTSADAGTGGSATAMGKYNTASADATMALNRGTSATNQAATSMGLGTTADNVGMLAVGVNNAAGIGDTTTDQYYYADGQYTGAPIGVAFVVGNGDVDTSNGLAGANPSNAFVVNYDGSATLSGDLTINSDSRLKSNIVTLGSTLSRLLLIDGKSYTMKANESISKIGLLAQEVQAAFPELVKTSNNSEGTLSVNYQGMIPVLLNAIKEQQAQIDELKALIKK